MRPYAGMSMPDRALSSSAATPEVGVARRFIRLRSQPKVSWALIASTMIAWTIWTTVALDLVGFGIVVPQVKGEWLKIGCLLAMQPEGGTNWVLGVVRRFTRDSSQQGSVGVQTIARSMIAARFSVGGGADGVGHAVAGPRERLRRVMSEAFALISSPSVFPWAALAAGLRTIVVPSDWTREREFPDGVTHVTSLHDVRITPHTR